MLHSSPVCDTIVTFNVARVRVGLANHTLSTEYA